MSELDLDAIEARAKAATPGPWDYEHDTELEKGCRCGSCLEPIDGRMIVESRKHDMVAVADARFIAHAREDVPALIAELRRLREENARLKDEGISEGQFAEEMLAEIVAHPNEESRWIPVEERLPEDEMDVLVWSNIDIIEVGHYNAKSRSFVTHGYYTQSVTHWRPLPKPPEVK